MFLYFILDYFHFNMFATQQDLVYLQNDQKDYENSIFSHFRNIEELCSPYKKVYLQLSYIDIFNIPQNID